MLHAARQETQLLQVVRFLCGINAAMQLAQHHGQLEQRGQLSGEGLGRRHADLGTGAGVTDQFAGARNRAFRHVADRQRVLVAQRLGVLQRFHRIQRFAGLGDGHDQVLGIGIRGAIAVLAGDLHAARQAGDGLDPVARGQARVVTGTTGEDLHAFDARQHRFGILAEQFGREATGVDGRFDGVAQCTRLLVDFLLHEVAVRAQFQRGQRDIGEMHIALDRLIVAVEDAHTITADLGGVALFQEDHLARGRQHGRHIGRHEVLALAQTDQQRAAHAGAHETFWFSTADHGQCIGTGQFLHRVLQRHQQVVAALQVMVHQVRDHFGVGLRLEGIAQRAQLLALLFMVLDDAVVHQRHAMADVRMRVRLGDTTMGGPTGVADAEAGIEAFGLGSGGHFRDATGAAHAAHVGPFGLIDHRNAGGIVTAVFQSLQSFDQQRHHVAPGDRTHDSTHVTHFLEDGRRILACVSASPLLSA
ncbi:hypothetical protein D3C72_729800 [compost metagenome]